MLCGGHQPLCHTGIFTRPFQAVFSLIHPISSGFHLPLNFPAHPPLLMALPIQPLPSWILLHWPFVSSAHTELPHVLSSRRPDRTGSALLCPRCSADKLCVGCACRAPTGAACGCSPARAGNRLPRQARPCPRAAQRACKMKPGFILMKSFWPDSLGNEAQSFMCFVITVFIHPLWTEAGLDSEERADFYFTYKEQYSKNFS